MTQEPTRTQQHGPETEPPVRPAHGAAFDPERGVAGEPHHATAAQAGPSTAAQARPGTAAEPGPGGAPGPARRAAGWFGGLSRGRKLALTWSASVLAVVVALLAIGATSSGSAGHAPPPRAQAFMLSELGHPGQHISLAQYAGHPLILNFFASWCEPCQRETPLIARFYRSHRRSVIIIGIDVNDTSSAGLAFARKMGVAYPVASDPAPMTMALNYGVSALPQTFFLNAQHRIVKRVIRAVTLTDLRSGVAVMTKQSARS
jgi:cytochrome c biogenesis protein CcmG, thiol:disulfide interchange protein DsbE